MDFLGSAIFLNNSGIKNVNMETNLIIERVGVYVTYVMNDYRFFTTINENYFYFDPGVVIEIGIGN